MMLRVYIASPYTKGDMAVNVRAQMEMADKLMDMGHCPIVPLYSHFQHMFRPRPYEDWLEIDLAKLEACDVLLRLPGESAGADREVQHAGACNIPVVYSIDDLSTGE